MSGPFDHPWLGGLFGDAETAVLFSPARQVRHMLAFEAAYTRALGHVGTISQSDAVKIAHQIETFSPEMADLHAGTTRDGLVVPALVAQLKQAIGPDTKGLHKGATSQDAIDTALALSLRDFNELLDAKLTALTDALRDLSHMFGDRTIMGRTRMQAALPMTLADRCLTWTAPLDGHRERLAQIRPRIAQLQLGGPVGDRTTFAPFAAEIAAHMATALNLNNPPAAWHSMREGIVDYANLLSLISGSIGKFGQDICLMAQQGIDEVTLSDSGASSAMPHKQNPILAELLVTLARFNATQIAGMHHALVHEQERSGAAWALEWMILPQMAQTTARSLSAATELCAKVTSLGAK